jgi:hypothetical protein
VSSATSLRSFLNDLGGPITQIAQEKIPESFNSDAGMIWFARRGIDPARTMEQSESGIEPTEQFFDIEVYHPDLDVVEAVTLLIHHQDCYRGDFGSGEVQGVFVSDQTDDYVQQVDTTDKENLSAAFISLEIRSYREMT